MRNTRTVWVADDNCVVEKKKVAIINLSLNAFDMYTLFCSLHPTIKMGFKIYSECIPVWVRTLAVSTDMLVVWCDHILRHP